MALRMNTPEWKSAKRELKGIVNLNEIQKKADSFLNSRVNVICRQINEEVHKKIYKDAILSWFKYPGRKTKVDTETLLKSTKYFYKMSQSKGNIHVDYYTQVILSKYNHIKRNSDDTRIYISKYDEMGDRAAYIYDLQFLHGIIGLPERSSRTAWINPHFVRREPLMDYLDSAFKKDWDKKCSRYLRKARRG